jgi:hypothetical protein
MEERGLDGRHVEMNGLSLGTVRGFGNDSNKSEFDSGVN